MQFFDRARSAVRDALIGPVRYTTINASSGVSLGFLSGGFFGAVSGAIGAAAINGPELVKGNNFDIVWLATRMNAAGDSLLGMCVGMIAGVHLGLVQSGYIENYNLSSNQTIILIIGLPLAGAAMGNQLLQSETPTINVKDSLFYAIFGGIVFCLAWFALSKLSNTLSQSRNPGVFAEVDHDNDPLPVVNQMV